MLKTLRAITFHKKLLGNLQSHRHAKYLQTEANLNPSNLTELARLLQLQTTVMRVMHQRPCFV